MLLRTLSIGLTAAALGTGVVVEPAPSSNTLYAWSVYIGATEARIGRELTSTRGFLAQDFTASAAADRRALLQGAVVVNDMVTRGPAGAELEIPDAMVHHWRGAVLIPNITVPALLDKLQNGGPPTRQEDVLKSAVLERGSDRMKVYLRLQKSKIVTVVYNTEHLVQFTRYGTTRASSTSTATKIAEIADPGTPSERELPAGQDRGFLWRLNAYWRYEQAGTGVIAECESLTLSRPIPYLLTYLVRPIVNSTARESMDRTLSSLRARFR